MKRHYYYHVAAYLPDGSIHAWEKVSYEYAKRMKWFIEERKDMHNTEYTEVRIIKTTSPTL